MIFMLFLSCIFIILLRYYTVYYGRFGRLINKLPGLPEFPILGHALEMCTSLEDFWTFRHITCKKYNPIFKLWIFTNAFVCLSHPDDIEKILSNSKEHLGKGLVYDFIKPWLGTGLLTSEGAKWHKRRKILTPAFHFNMLKQFVDVLIEEGNCMALSLKDIDGSIIEDLTSFISHHTLNAICETAMGTSLQNMGEFGEQYRNAVHEIGKMIIYRIPRPWFQFNMIFALSPMGRKHRQTLKILHGFTEKIITDRKKYHEITNGRYLKQFENDTVTKTDDEEIMGTKKKRLAMLDLLIAESRNNGMNDTDIREEVDTFMFEGHDTVAMGICYAILLLAEHKDVQDRVRDEVNTVMRENDGKLTMTALNNLPYLERCLKESLRLYPSVPLITRVLSEDVKLQSYLLPAGAIVQLDIRGVHRDPNFWSNPTVFDPDRFLPECIQNRHPFSYIPFSAGSRNCIGQRFALLELKALIAPLVHNFYFEPIDYTKDFRFIIHLITRTAHPIRVKFIPIEHLK